MKHCKNKSNLDIVKNYLSGDRPFTQVGYVPKKVDRKIGEIFIDNNGIKWQQKNGYKVRINEQATQIKKLSERKCNQCNRDMKWSSSKLDHIFYNKTGLCADCLIDYETKLRILGIYNEYEMYKLISNEISLLIDAQSKIQDTINFFSNNSGDIELLCNSQGFTERWKNINKDNILDNAKKDLNNIQERMSNLQDKKENYKKIFVENAKKYNIDIYV